MSRDEDALRITKWAATGDRTLPNAASIDRAEGWDVTYSQAGGPAPQRTIFNQLLSELGALGVEINTHGAALCWDATIEYIHPALVYGDDDLYYISVQNSTDEDPVTDTDNSHWVLLSSAATREFFIVEDQKPSGTSGGASVSGARQTRDLNTILQNNIGATLSSNQFTLLASTRPYRITGITGAHDVERHKCFLRNVTAGSDAIVGSSEFSDTVDNVRTHTSFDNIITIGADTTFRLEHFTEFGGADRLGAPTSQGVEVYSRVIVERL